MICLKNVTKIYSQGESSVAALRELSLTLGASGLVSVVGESGCGKTTLLNLLGGLDRQTEGEILIDGKDTAEFSEAAWNAYRSARLGFVFQEYNILEELTVEENIRMPLQILEIDEARKQQMTDDVIERMGLAKERRKKCSRLSGGQKQRVAIARAYVKRPDIILADEPTGNLDAENSKNIFRILRELSGDTLVVTVTHDSALAEEYSDRIIELREGRQAGDLCISQRLEFAVECASEPKQTAGSFEELRSVLRRLFYEGVDSCTLRLNGRKRGEDAAEAPAPKEAYTGRRLEKRELWRLSRRILEKRKVRQAVTVLVFSLTLFFLLTAIAFFSYREEREVARYLRENDIERTGVCLPVDYSVKGDSETEIRMGMAMERKLSEALGKLASLEKQCVDMELATDSGLISGDEKEELSGFRAVSVTGETAPEEIFAGYGSRDEGAARVIVTDYVADQLALSGDAVGTTLYLKGEPVLLAGIRKTGYESVSLCRKAQRSESEEYYFQEKFNRIWYDDNYLKTVETRWRREGVSVMSNYFFSSIPFSYLNQSMHVASAEQLPQETALAAGRLPERAGEIAVATGFLAGLLSEGESAEDYLGRTYSLKDLGAEQYQGAYDDCIDLRNYVGGQVEIVGILEGSGTDIAIAGAVYEPFFTDYMQYFYADELLVRLEAGNWSTVIAHIHKLGYRIVDPLVADIYAIGQGKSAVMPYLCLAVLAMLLLTAFLFVSLISFSVQDNRKKIGILRSLGFVGRDIKLLFAAEGVAVTSAASLLAFGGYLGLLFAVRRQNVVEEANRVCHLIGYHVPTVLMVLLAVNVLAFFFAWLPMKEMDRMELVEVIRETD